MRRRYLKEYRPALYSSLLLSEKLYSHLLEIDETANARMDILMPQLMKATGATEELKAANPMKWVGLANACKAQAEELVLTEIFCENRQNLVKQRITPHFLTADHPNYYEFTTKG